MNCAECMEPAVARGLCHRHYQKYAWRKKHNPDTWEGWPYERLFRQAQRGRCELCPKKSYARGLCRPHYKYLGRRGHVSGVTNP